ncbi:uncharacterized protein MELLADRAFT_84950 [Melampsora larici-populina 98AG31]|uniref:F-box domain-containing protein n=1 Tax=Melampsora larici-populina (strain 98AG31 / pathotype 3-4-7) TaxID=747676 RepID=F4RHH9_MELLP|nr:uncharacterized protein MELLADRAFT_84950 [Melampsora larici-populina 98AG31]EGG08177.1 hypothetical protein MELLADRAFT_84950 [Melampsora larici-populina 98AG31]
MHDIGQIITMCSKTLTSLRFVFRTSVGFSPSIIGAVKQVENLKVLNIIGGSFGTPINDLESLKDLLEATLRLQSLSLELGFLQRLHISPESLRYLEHLSVKCTSNNSDALAHLCKFHGKNIKCLEYIPHHDRDQATSMLLAVRSTIKILFTDSVPNSLAVNVRNVTFPLLKVVCTLEPPTGHRDLRWLESEFFRNMKIMITNYDHSNDYWHVMLRNYNGASLTTPPDFKHIIFVTQDGVNIEDRPLAQRFEVYGICCVFRAQLSYSEIMHGACAYSGF